MTSILVLYTVYSTLQIAHNQTDGEMARTAEHEIDEERKRSSVKTEHGAEAGELSVGETLWEAHSQSGGRARHRAGRRPDGLHAKTRCRYKQKFKDGKRIVKQI